MPINIEEIARTCDRKSFDCGVTELNQFLMHQARQKAAKNFSKTYVACQDTEPNRIVGYLTLTGYSVTIPPTRKYYKKYPHPLSAVKLARQAVAILDQGQGLGERLLIDAICWTVSVAQQISAIGLFIDPMTSQVVPFYQKYEFLPVVHNQHLNELANLEMWLPIKTCIEISRVAQ